MNSYEARSQRTEYRTGRMRPVVLLVEGDRGLRRQLRMALERDYRVIEAATGAEGLAQGAVHSPDLAIVNRDLPDCDGVHLMSKVRQRSAAPIIVVSRDPGDAEKIAALDAGANDYVLTPLRTNEVLARVRVWLRAMKRLHAGSLRTEVAVGNIRIDFLRQKAYVRQREVPLTPKQYRLFALMMRNVGRLLSHELLLSSVWGSAYVTEKQYLRVYMGHLRRKFEDDPARPRYLLTEPGAGYRLRGDDEDKVCDATAPTRLIEEWSYSTTQDYLLEDGTTV